MDLFEKQSEEKRRQTAPLAERIRPTELNEVLGQDHLLGDEGPLRVALEKKEIPSFVLWGPPGTGKTTIARIIAEKSGHEFVPFSAVLAGIKEVREVMKKAEGDRIYRGKKTIVFIDEIHRFNKAQQDAFLPFVERGDVVLIGATTENPSFEINNALLSRLQVFVIHALNKEESLELMSRALREDQELAQKNLLVDPEALSYLASRNPGDARACLNLLEACSRLLKPKGKLTKDIVDRAAQRVALLYDKTDEEHYNTISALHKSMRNGDVQASLYWLARMLEAGEDPLYVARRVIRFASEDIGNADPQALRLCLDAKDTVHFLGMPEGKLALAQAVIYCATAPKSNSVYKAYGRVERDFKAGKVYPVPHEIRNAPTNLMKDLGYGEGYEYAHDREERTTALQCLPEELEGTTYYKPNEVGFEREIAKRMRYFESIRKKLRDED